MDEDYESAKKLLDDLRKKYSTKNTNEENSKSKGKISKKPSTATTLDDLKKKYLSKSTDGNNECGTLDKPATYDVQTQNKRQKKTKDRSPKAKLPKSSSSSSKNTEVVTTVIDTNIITKYGSDITEKLQESNIFYKSTDQICSGLVTWIRSSSTQDIDRQEDCKEVVIILDWDDVIPSIKSHDFLCRIKSLQEILPSKKVFLGLYGINNYFRYWKMQASGNMSKADVKRLAEYKNCTKISRGDFEIALTEVQLACNCCYRLLASPQDIIDLILQFTKSVTQMPEKLQNREKYKDYEWHMLKDNRDCVAVDKNGNGLQRLWQQQLTSFEMARLETAEAVMAQYSTPSKLYEEYRQCSELEGQKLLEDIPVRRSAGPLSSSRKVGPELSGKVYTFFNSIDGNAVL